ncbi:MAG: response regulator [Candidatus Buchananbacteria bacterium]|nr:response regulator [Candidatus Buchananbacteria bacterium]
MKKILVIEDDNILQSAISTALKDAGFSTVQSFDGVDGLKKAKKNNINLILLDLLMPKKDGWEVLKMLKKDNKTKNIPVFVLTVYEGENSISKCLSLGAKGYFIKSKYSLDEIIKNIKNEIGKAK